MDLMTVERHKTIVEQGMMLISIIILTFYMLRKSSVEKILMENILTYFSELYFLIAKFLLESPFKDVAKVIMNR